MGREDRHPTTDRALRKDRPAPEGEAASSVSPSADLSAWTWRVVESVGALAVVTAILYFIGYSYYAGYFSRLSVPAPYSNLDTSDCVIRAFTNFVPTLYVLFFLVTSPSLRIRRPVSRRQALYSNLTILVGCFLLLTYSLSLEFFNWFIGIYLASALAVTMAAALVKASLVGIIDASYGGVAGRIYYAVLLVWFASVYFGAQGEHDAKRLMEGTLERSSTVTLTMRDPRSGFNGRTFALITIRDDHYYVVEQASSAPERPAVFAIPSAEVVAAELQLASGTRVAAGR